MNQSSEEEKPETLPGSVKTEKPTDLSFSHKQTTIKPSIVKSEENMM
jgi:hypothetical protein